MAEFQNLPVLDDGVEVELAILLLEDADEISPEQLERIRDTLKEIACTST